MFLWAKLVMEELKHRQCVNDLRAGVKDLPEGLQETYVAPCFLLGDKTNYSIAMVGSSID